MKNEMIVKSVAVDRSDIVLDYDVTGPWASFFETPRVFRATYGISLDGLPESVAVIPFLCNILPIAWLCDASVILDQCDEDFYESIPEFRKGYAEMYPAISFRGNIRAGSLVKNTLPELKGSAAFFSGGVDAFFTLLSHMDEKPDLMTVWGADIGLDDEEGWENVFSHTKSTAGEAGLDCVTIKTNFRRFIRYPELDRLVSASGDGWWHGFQHGIGLIGHAAPYAYQRRRATVYIAASLSADDGMDTCASYPTIDGNVRFFGCEVEHDGFESRRQDKVRFICRYAEEKGRRFLLRVCWMESGGANCGRCEKCARTMLAIKAENGSPADYGFPWDKRTIRQIKRLALHKEVLAARRWNPILERMRERYGTSGEWGWLTGKTIDEINRSPVKKLRSSAFWKLLRRLKSKIFKNNL